MFRALRRARQAVNDADCKRVLQTARRGVLAVHGDDGYPYAVPLNFYYNDADGKLYFHCALEGHKLDAMARDEKVCFTVWGDETLPAVEWAWYVTSVVLFGRAQRVTDPAQKDAMLRALGKKYFPETYDLESEMTRHAAGAAVFAIAVEHMSGKRVHEK